MLIEDVGVESAVAQQSSVPSSVSIGGGSYKVKGNWSKGEYSSLHHALSKMSKASHAKATGLTFTRKSGQAGGGEPAHYDEVADAVEVFDNTFQDKSLRTGGVTMSARSILHEIGHALDLRPLEAEWGKFNAAGQSKAAKKTLEKKRSLSGSRYKLAVPRTWPQQAGLAAEGNWAALKALQEELNAGK